MLSKLLLVGLYVASAAASTISRQIQLGDIEYFVPSEPAWKLNKWNISAQNEEFMPLTVVKLKGAPTDASITSALEGYEKDDVWTKYFAQSLYLQAISGKPINFVSDTYNVSALYTGNQSIPAGPYFVHRYTGNVYQAYRLYADTAQAFIQSTYQDPSGSHHPLRAGIQSAAGLTIAVPSRLYFTPTAAKPLAGVRIAVKDLYDLRGVKTSFGSRAWYKISDVKNETATAVQRLIDAGAIIVGKNKLSQFANAGVYVTEHIDYLLPFNPRGDGYQSPSDSSGGSAAAVASYDWLDASMGSDTGGSVRGPAIANGVHGNRPTQDAVDLTGALPFSTSLDTAGMLTRDPVIWGKINRVLYGETTKEYNQLPSQIYIDPGSQATIDDFERRYPEAGEAVNKFLDGLSTLLSAKVTSLLVDDVWNASKPESYADTGLGDIISNLYGGLTFYEQWIEFGKAFLQNYKDSHNGASPYVTPYTLEGWQGAEASGTEETHQDDLALKKVVGDWVEDNLFIADEKSCSKSVYVYISMADPLYKPDVAYDFINPYIRQVLLQSSQQLTRITELETIVNCNSTLGSEEACKESQNSNPDPGDIDFQQPVALGRLASVAGFPDYSITLGAFDMRRFSNATQQDEKVPISVSLMANRGCDFVVLDIIEALHKQGAIKTVKTGAIP